MKKFIYKTLVPTAFLTLIAVGAAAQQDDGHAHDEDGQHSHGDDAHSHEAPSETETFFGSDAESADTGGDHGQDHAHDDEEHMHDDKEHMHDDEGHAHE